MPSLSPRLQQASDVLAVRGEGVYLHGDDGRVYLDFTSGIGVTSTGHCHPRVVEAAQRQVGQLIHGQYTTIRHRPLLELSERLVRALPDGLDSVFYANAGTESVEAAIRLARHVTGRANLVAMQGGFHGRTMGSLALTTSKTTFSAGLQPLMGGTVITPFPYAYRYGWTEEEATRFCLRELDFTLVTVSAPEETAAVIVEPVLGEGGFVPAPSGFLAGLRERCDEHGMLLIVDEVQTGVGRTGRFWGHEHDEVHPDIVITAKGIASGFPLSAFAAPIALMEQAWPGSQGGTYGGNAVACAAALATLDVIAEEGLVDRAAELGAHLRAQLTSLQSDQPTIGDVRGRGLMVGAEFSGQDRAPDTDTAARVQKAAEERGLLLLRCGTHGNVVRFLPPLVVTRGQLDEALEIFADAVAAVA